MKKRIQISVLVMLVVRIENAMCFPRLGVTIEKGESVLGVHLVIMLFELMPSSLSERPNGQINNWHARLD